MGTTGVTEESYTINTQLSVSKLSSQYLAEWFLTLRRRNNAVTAGSCGVIGSAMEKKRNGGKGAVLHFTTDQLYIV